MSIPHWVWRDKQAADESATGGLSLLRHLVALSELKVGSTTDKGMGYAAIVYDIVKLEVLLAEAQRLGVKPTPCAFMCVLDNHERHSKKDAMEIRRLAKRELGFAMTVELLIHASTASTGGA